jgi:hypothetical protein
MGRRWVQAECRELGDQDAPEVEALLQRGARALRQRSVLFRYCAEEVRSALWYHSCLTSWKRGNGGRCQACCEGNRDTHHTDRSVASLDIGLCRWQLRGMARSSRGSFQR